jgi:hypothetical protein
MMPTQARKPCSGCVRYLDQCRGLGADLTGLPRNPLRRPIGVALTVPVRGLMKEGYEITFANPKGNTPQMDVNSAIAQFFGGDEAKLQDYLKFRDSLTGLKNSTRISDVIASGLDQYDAVFVPEAMARC